MADSEIARHLCIPVGAHVANARRVFCAPGGTVFYPGEVVYRGDLVQLDADLVP